MEVEKPATTGRVQLVRASTQSLEVCWTGVPTAEHYVLQIQKYDMPVPPTILPVSSPTPTSLSVISPPHSSNNSVVSPVSLTPLAASTQSPAVRQSSPLPPFAPLSPTSSSPETPTTQNFGDLSPKSYLKQAKLLSPSHQSPPPQTSPPSTTGEFTHNVS